MNSEAGDRYSRGQNGRAWLPAVVLGAGLLAYLSSFSGAFVFDDSGRIVSNERIRQLWPPWPLIVGQRSPVNLSLAVNYALGELNPWGYHAFNLGIHLLAALTLYGIVHRTLLHAGLGPTYGRRAPWLALAVALLWVVHPLQTQSVTYVIQRAESMMGLFYLLTLYCVIRGEDSSRRRRWYAAAVVSCAMGMSSKAVMVTAPVAVLLYDRAFLAGSLTEVVRRRWALYVVLAATLGILAAGGVVRGVLFPAPEARATVGFAVKGLTPAQYALTQPGVIVHYLKLSFWPISLCLDYAWPVARRPGEIVPPAVLVGLLLLGTIAAYWHKPRLGVIGAWFFLILAPTSSFIPIQDLAFEHRMYLSLAGVIVLVVIAGHAILGFLLNGLQVRGRGAEWISIGLLTAVAGLLGYRTFERNKDYRSALAIWQATVSVRPENCRAHSGLGKAYQDKGRLDQAIQSYRRALELCPVYATAHNNLGSALTLQGRIDKATEHYKAALRIQPDYAEAYVNLGKALAQQGNMTEAIAPYRKALQLDPDDAVTHYNLGVALQKTNQLERASSSYRQALQLAPTHSQAHINLGAILALQGRLDEAIGHYRTALQLEPDRADIHNNLGAARAAKGQFADAIRCYREALRLDAEHADAHNNLGAALASTGQPQRAMFHYREALRLRPVWPQLKNNLAWALATLADPQLRDGAKAVELAEQACEATHYHDPSFLDTLAAAYAETGRFAEATATARKALQVAAQNGNTLLARSIEARLQLYAAERPYHSTAGSP